MREEHRMCKKVLLCFYQITSKMYYINIKTVGCIMSEHVRRMTIQMSEDLGAKIDSLASRMGQPKTSVASMALLYGVQQIEDGIRNPVARAAEKSIATMAEFQGFVGAMGSMLGLKKDKNGVWYQQEELKLEVKTDK